MKENGFVPLTTIGLIILVISGTFVGYVHWNNHTNEIHRIHNSGETSLMCKISSKKQNLKQHFNDILYDTLWDVSRQAYFYENFGIENSIEKIASIRLKKKLSILNRRKNKNPFNPQLFTRKNEGKFRIDKGKDGCPIGKVILPYGSSISGSLIDNSLMVSLPIKKTKFLNDTRFYLLKNKMSQFKEEFGEVGRRWKFAEYSLAYSQIWLNNKLSMNKNKSKILFQLALLSKELEKFGSFDYGALKKDLLIPYQLRNILDDIDSRTVIKPIKKNEIQKIESKIENSLLKAIETEKMFKELVLEFSKISISKLEKKFKGLERKSFDLLKDLDKIDQEEAKRKFKIIQKNLEKTSNYPIEKISKTEEKIERTKNLLIETNKLFDSALEEMKELSGKNPLLKQLHKNLTEKKGLPSIKSQIKYGKKNITENLNCFKNEINQLKKRFIKNSDFLEDYSQEIGEIFEKRIEENQINQAEKIIREFFSKVKIKSCNFIKSKQKEFNFLEKTKDRLKKFLKRQTKIPKPNWKKEYRKYQINENKRYEKNLAKKYVIYKGKGTIGGIKEILRNIKAHLGKLDELGKNFQKKQNDLEELDLDRKIIDKIKENINYNTPERVNRENLYRISPPKPIRLEPGLSVYHDINIKSIKHIREDPLGLIKKSAPPTPIYLWFIDTTIYWAQFKLELRIDTPLIEEIFDYKNQVIPRPISKKSLSLVHKPLPYKQKIERKKFEFRLVALSLRPFQISCN